MKKLTAIFLITALVLTMTACGGSGETAQPSAASASAVSASSAVSEAKEVSAASETAAASAVSETSEASETADVSETESASSAEPLIEEEAQVPIVDEDLAPADCVEIGNYKGLEVKDSYVAPTEKDIDDYIKTLVVPVPVEDESSAVAEGDTANIDYVGKIDGVEFDGGSAEGYDLGIGSGTFIPGFEDGVIGMKKGEVKDIDVTFPENYGNPDYAGKAAVFTVTLNEIKRTPELTDDWVKENSGTESQTVEEFKAYLMDYFEKNLRRSATSSMQLELWNQVMESSTINKLPKSFYDAAAENFDILNTRDAEEYGMTLDEFLEANSVTEEYYNEMKESYARESGINTLLSYAIWDAEGMTTDSEEYINAIDEIAEGLGLSREELDEQYGEDTIDNYGKTYGVLTRILSYATILPADDAADEAAQEEPAGN